MLSPARTVQFISPQRLNAFLAQKTIVPLDASWFMPSPSPTTPRRSGSAEFKSRRVPGARFFDVDKVADLTTTRFPHMLPLPRDFSAHMTRLGIGRTSDVCVYDSSRGGVFSAPRVAWTFVAFGHGGVVSVLAGGLDAYAAAGFALDTHPPMEADGAIRDGDGEGYGECSVDGALVAGYDELVGVVRANQGTSADGASTGTTTTRTRTARTATTPQIVDARPRARFTGAAPEPRPGLSSGHMPGAISLPFTALLAPPPPSPPPSSSSSSSTPSTQVSMDTDVGSDIDAYTDPFLADTDARALIAAQGIDLARPIITSCGSGVTAAILWLAFTRLGAVDVKVYDESWTGYADATRAGDVPGMIVKGSGDDVS